MEIVTMALGIWIAFSVHLTRRLCSVGGRQIVQYKIRCLISENIIQENLTFLANRPVIT
jgi:hypothetical protein